ncbi:MAG: ABC transporter substrate-binding protein [Thermodesulfobacteriota bacterium]
MSTRPKDTQPGESKVDAPAIELTPGDREALAGHLSTGGMTRRQAMKWLMAMGISAVAANSLATRWSEAAEATPKPKRGGRMRVAGQTSSVKESLDPTKYTCSTDYARGFTFFNGLTRLDGKAQAQPELATSFEPNADATRWVFKLRKGVTFHDGKTLDADDVVYSIMRHKDPKVGSAAKGLADLISEVKADGKDTVIISLNGSNGDLPILLGTYHFLMVKNGTTDFSTAIGTGPYKVKEFKPGIRSIGVRNENYFLEGRPYMEEQEFFGIADDAARLNALYSGDVHMVASIALASVADVEKRQDVKVVSTKAPRFTSLVMMVDRPPFNNPDLRLAMKHLFDREKVLKTIMKGHGQLGNDHLFAPDDPYYNASLPQRKLDRDKAKYHLKKAGMENAKLELHVSEAAYASVELGMLLQSEAARVGCTIELKREPSDGYWSNIWRQRSFHAGEWNARPTNDLLLSIGFMSNAKWNESQYKNERLDQLINEGRATVDFAKRKQIYGEVQKILYEDGCNVVPCFTNYIGAVNGKVRGLTHCKTGGLGGYNFADTAWLDT